jgi:hypothetical protein
MAGREEVDQQKAGQGLGQRMHQHAGERRRGGRPRLGGDDRVDRHAVLDGGQHHADRVRADVDLAAGPLFEFALAAENPIEHLDRGRDVLADHEAGADVFLGARRDGVDRVDVELEVVGEVRPTCFWVPAAMA